MLELLEQGSGVDLPKPCQGTCKDDAGHCLGSRID